MPHQCINWLSNRRRINVLVLSHGDTHVYTIVPTEFKDLQELARKEFDLGDADFEFYSSCHNVCNSGIPARIREQVWSEISSYIGCLSVVMRDPPASEHPVQPSNTTPSTPPPEQSYRLDVSEPDVPMNATQEYDSGLIASMNETGTGDADEDLDVPAEDPNDRTKSDNNRPLTLVQDEDLKTSGDEGKSQGTTRQLRRRRSVGFMVTDDEDPTPRRRTRRELASSSIDNGQSGKRESGSKTKKQRVASMSRSPSKGAIKERETIDLSPLKTPAPAQDFPSPIRPIKLEKTADKTPMSSQIREEDLPSEPTNTQVPTDSGQQHENQRVVIRVAHRISRQESKFTVKGSTKVSKVITSVCRSFGLDPSQARLFLIVDTDDDDGIMENLFPCDSTDSMVKAGAEASGESKFLLKLAEEN
ncbi:hypothetical protein SCLCIDRAFT_1213721 [Scleroderma citrinum Foug A]|uniref:Uncharacterized protein n=1 Tax=Scleroderma citrinum Foug A TaxID=1036808 RepID=A0A0C3AG72_9AGAM|nr:hypothetical protein SCLCIDRAFT_1213721 [Scleroderma citrinum Foug A]